MELKQKNIWRSLNVPQSSNNTLMECSNIQERQMWLTLILKKRDRLWWQALNQKKHADIISEDVQS